MNVPLSVNPTVDNHTEKLKIWFDNEEEIIDSPIKPYYYAFERLSNPAKISKVDKKALSDYQPKTFLKYEFKTRSELVKYRVKGKTFEDNIPFVLRNRLDDPDIYVDFPHTNKLKFLFLDIEQYIKPEKMSPMYNDRIISIAWCGNDRKIKCVYLTKERKDDRKLLEFFIEDYRRIDPDAIVCYNKKYDIPTILRRCKQVNIDTTQFSKNRSKPFIGGKEAVNIGGVVVYDVYLSAKADQSLNGNVANRGLKAVSDYFGFEKVIEPLDTKQTHKYVGTKELVKYNRDDVKRLLLLFDIYWSNIEFNANDLKIPLNTALELNTTDLGIVVMGDEYRKDGIIADGTNYYRFPEIFQVRREGGKYEGALVGIDRTGIFEPVYKADYSCVDEETEALTNNGWKKYYEIKDDDKLFTWNLIDDRFDLEKPQSINIYDYDDDLIYSESRNISMAVTPNHRVYFYYVRGQKKGDLDVKKSEDLPTYIDVPITSILRESYTTNKHEKYIPLIAWVITEGSIRNIDIMISQRKCVSLENSIDYVRNVIKQSGLEFVEKKRKNRPDVEFRLRKKERDKILKIMGNDGKHIPDFIFWTDYKTRKNFIKELVYGDGTDYSKSKKHHSSSMVYVSKDKKLIHEIQMLCTITNYRTTFSKQIDNRNGKAFYYLHIFERTVTGLRLNRLRPTKDKLYVKKHYKGKVWCPTTENKTFVCRRNNKVHITGNSMYPTIMSSFNLSPDTVTLVRYDMYSKFKIEEKEDHFIYHIPDRILNKTMVLKVLKKIGFMSELVARFLRERSEYKKLWKQTGEKKYRALSDNRKVKANGGAYGNQGALNHPFGFAPIAVATCGIGRECAQLLIDVLLKLYKNSVIEKDTDGVYFIATNVNKEKIYELFEKSLSNKFKKELDLSIDIDDYDKGYFYKTKNYVLQRGKNLIFHGVAMKASSKNKISKSLINELAHATLNEKTTGRIIREYRKLDFPLNDFAMSVTLGMRLRDYKSKNAIASRMAIDAERKLDIKAVVGTQYHYIKTHNGYKLLDIAKKSDIDGDYYLNQVNRIIKMFDAENVSNNLDKWL